MRPRFLLRPSDKGNPGRVEDPDDGRNRDNRGRGRNSGFRNQLIRDPCVVHPAIAQADECGDTAAQIDDRVGLDRRLHAVRIKRVQKK